MNSLLKILIFMCMFLSGGIAQNIGQFENNTDVGNPIKSGFATYNTENQEYTIGGAGINLWSVSDQFHYLCKKIKGDFIMSCTVKFVGAGVAEHRKIGIMARDKLTAGSRYADACVHGSELTSLQYRLADTGTTDEVKISVFHPLNIQLERVGNLFIFSAATEGQNYKTVSKEVVLNDEVYAGLFVCSHADSVVEKAIFSNVRIVLPAPIGYSPEKNGYYSSHIEEMDVMTGHRKILFTAPNSLQAPNWTKDGKSLIYNSEGKLYRFDLATKQPILLNSGFVTDNNNDHVISFDGKMLGISNFVRVGENRVSTIYTLPIIGADKPVQITKVENGHSYLHGWSPDGKDLVFTGMRNKVYDIYKIDIATQKEIQLTHTPTLDDSPEYTPDGKWIYFNSVRTGTMKLWRMYPDGSHQEQITFDDYNDWFPHISPDGKLILFLSFYTDIDPSSHPWYKKVYLRIMPINGGPVKTIAYLYGGQGTINTPSWSPDSKKVAFVSNTRN